MKPVAIVGAGPAGLAVAAALSARRVPYVVIDAAGEPGGAYRTVYPRMTLVSPPDLNELPGLALANRDRATTAEALLDYLARYARHHAIAIDRAEVGNVTRTLDPTSATLRVAARPGGAGAFELTTDRGAIAARAVVVASGMWRFAERPEIPGLPAAAIHSRDYRGPTGERTLVIGGGASGVEIAEDIARAGAPVTIAVRRPIRCIPASVLGVDLHRLVAPLERVLPTWLARRHCSGTVKLPPTDHGFAELRAARRIDVRPRVLRFAGATAQFADGSTLDAERVIVATGFAFRTPYLPDAVARAPGGHVVARRGRSVSWPGLYVVGHPCSVDLASQFLRGMARDAQVVADAIAR